MTSQSPYKVFFAVPFDTATRSMYESIKRNLKKSKYKHYFDFDLGTTIVKPSKHYSNIEEFKAQNRDFVRRFYQKIRSSDIIVADLTNDNPSVHIELGIAFALNKNTLRVMGRELVRLATDIKGQETNTYMDQGSLEKMIKQYLDRFLEIKRLSLHPRASPYYIVHFPEWEELGPKKRGELDANFYPAPTVFRMRDGEIKVRFKIHETLEKKDWFGISLRSATNNPWGGGYLVLVREEGRLDLVGMMQNARVLKGKKYPPLKRDKQYTLHVKIDGSNLIASLDDGFTDCLRVENLDVQSPGSVVLGCFRSRVSIRKVQVICRDAIDFLW